jgi:hypothetical protein
MKRKHLPHLAAVTLRALLAKYSSYLFYKTYTRTNVRSFVAVVP